MKKMQRKIKHIRRSIKQRRVRKQIPKGGTSHYLTTNYLAEHEKHGDVQLYPTYPITQKRKQRTFSFTLLKGILALLLFGLSFVVFKTNFFPMAEPKEWLEKQLTKE